MDTIVAVQDLRTSLAAITERATRGETFLVMRNSRPAFRIVPAEQTAEVAATPRKPAMKLGELRARYQAGGLSKALGPADLEAMIRDVHEAAR